MNGQSVTELALESHPFVCGNRTPQKLIKQNKAEDASNEFESVWGGKKHHKMCAAENIKETAL